MKLKFAWYIGVIILSVGIIATSLYYLLGGFEKINVYRLPAEQKIVVGQAFSGRYTDKTIQKQFFGARKLIEENAIKGSLVQIVFKEDSLADNEVAYFTGVAIEGSMAEVPAGYEVRKYNCEEKFAVFLSMHPLVRPSPTKIEAMLSDAATKAGYQLKPFTIELHYSDDTMSVEGYAEKK